MPNDTASKPTFSFAGLTVEDAVMPKSAASEARGKDNPLNSVMRASAGKNSATTEGSWFGVVKAMTVPASAVGELVGLIRGAADYLNVGSKIKYVQASAPAVQLEWKSVGAKKDPITGKSSGGKMTVLKDGVPFSGGVKVIFQAKNRKGANGADASE